MVLQDLKSQIQLVVRSTLFFFSVLVLTVATVPCRTHGYDQHPVSQLYCNPFFLRHSAQPTFLLVFRHLLQPTSSPGRKSTVDSEALTFGLALGLAPLGFFPGFLTEGSLAPLVFALAAAGTDGNEELGRFSGGPGAFAGTMPASPSLPASEGKPGTGLGGSAGATAGGGLGGEAIGVGGPLTGEVCMRFRGRTERARRWGACGHWSHLPGLRLGSSWLCSLDTHRLAAARLAKARSDSTRRSVRSLL